jgi:hypothetical protein
LQRAFWLYGVGVTVVYSLVGGFVPARPAALAVYFGLGLLIGVVQSVVLWRCAPNARSGLTRRLVRAAVVAGLLLTALVFGVLVLAPASLPPELRLGL